MFKPIITEIYTGTFELSQPPYGVIGTMWVTEATVGMSNYFVLKKGINFPIAVTPESPLTFSALNLGTITEPTAFYMASMRYLNTEEVTPILTNEAQQVWEP